MEAKALYQKLDRDFKLAECRDDWSKIDLGEYICPAYKKRYMGLLLDNSSEIKQVYTAVFPSDRVLNEILKAKVKDALLFVHHPMVWDIRKPQAFTNINPKLLPKLRENRISMYNLHVPLDNNGPYSTSVALAKALGVELTKDEFFEYFGTLVGTVGKTEFRTVEELAKHAEKIIGHRVRIYKYSFGEIKGGLVGFVGGGGNDKIAHTDLKKLGVNTFVTGITVLNERSRETHELAKKNKINLIGLTHYSSEKFACIAMCGYFEKLGLPCKFLADEPVLEDM